LDAGLEVIKSRAKEDPQAKRLMTIPGVGFILTYLFLSEIRDINWGFIEAAGSAIRFNPELKYWADRIKAKKGAGVAICAVA